MYENINVLKVCGNKFSWGNFFQLYIIEISVHELPISYNYIPLRVGYHCHYTNPR